MDEIIQKAKLGNRSSVTLLYNLSQDSVYATSFLLLGNEEKAKKVTSNIFSAIWNGFENSTIQTKKDFANVCIEKAVIECKKIILRNDPKGFQPPKNQNFTVISEKTPSDFNEALSALSTLQKFIFISRVVCKMTPEQIAKIAYVDVSTVKLAISSEKMNFERMGFSLDKAENQIIAKFKELKYQPDDASDVVDAIDNYVTPFEKKALVSKIKIMSGVLTVCIIISVIIIAFMIIGNGDDNTSAGTISKDTSSNTIPQDNWATSVVATDYAVIDIKDYGKISIALDSKTAPITVANFKKLANEGFYEGLKFHRIIEGFMMQGGNDATKNVPEIKGEFYANGVSNNLSHVRGAISMARTDVMDSANSQFFIVHEDSTFLDGKYAAFGYVVDGIEVVDKVCTDSKPTDNNGTIPKDEQPIINSVKIYSVEEFKAMTESSSDSTNESNVSEETSTDNSKLITDNSVISKEEEFSIVTTSEENA